MTALEELLSRPKRNDLFRALEKSGAPVSEFRLTVGGRSAVQLETGIAKDQGVFIRHDASGSYFFMQGLGVYRVSGTIMNGDPSMTAIEGTGAFIRTLGLTAWRRIARGSFIGQVMAVRKGMVAGDLVWYEIVPLVEKWAQAAIAEFRQYEAIPDLWAELQQSRQLLSAPSDNTPFSEAEQAEISRGMQQVRTFITAVPELTADQLAEVNNRLDEMEEASRRLGRKDWLMLFNGVVFSLILTDTITPQAAQRIIMLGLQGLGHLFGLGGPPAPLP